MGKIRDERETGKSQIGYCIYCGQAMQIPVEEETAQEKLDAWATERCDCTQAKTQQDWATTKNQSEVYIESLFAEDHPEMAKTLKENIRNCFAGNFDMLNIKVGTTTAKMKRKESENGIKIEINRTDTSKVTRLAER